MTYLQINESTLEGKKILAFLETQEYIRIFHAPNEVTKAAIKAAHTGKTTKAASIKGLIKDILG